MIKVRAFHKGTMYYSHNEGYPGYVDLYHGQWEIREVYESGDHGGTIEISDDDVEQWIGPADKTGVEMFEGDIVKHNQNLFTIKWSSNLLGWVARAEIGMNWRDGDWLVRLQKHVEIIGNVKENPELLEEP